MASEDEDEIGYEFTFDENFRCFNLTIDAKRPMEMSTIVQELRAFAQMLEDGEIDLLDVAEEVVQH